MLPLLSLFPFLLTLATAYLRVDEACPIFDGQGALGFGRQIRSSSTSFAWTSAGSAAGKYMTDELDTDGNEIANTAMEYKEIADYWCITAGYTGADQFSTVKVGNAGQTMFHRLTSQVKSPIECHLKGMQSATLAFYVASERFKVVQDLTCTGSRRRLRGNRSQQLKKITHQHL